jgi:hypothetical protein
MMVHFPPFMPFPPGLYLSPGNHGNDGRMELPVKAIREQDCFGGDIIIIRAVN